MDRIRKGDNGNEAARFFVYPDPRDIAVNLRALYEPIINKCKQINLTLLIKDRLADPPSKGRVKFFDNSQYFYFIVSRQIFLRLTAMRFIPKLLEAGGILSINTD
jgi:hypothetical protein